MSRFANAVPRTSAGAQLGLIWLAGLLEAEGTFLRPPPSEPRYPIVACRMTDRDVIERVASSFGTSVFAVDKGQYRTEYGARLKGSSAVALMADLRPLMSKRRRVAIDRAVDDYRSPSRKLSFRLAEEVRAGYIEGESVSALARSHRVARQTVHAVLQGRVYPFPERTPWQGTPRWSAEIDSAQEGLSLHELFWLAGWLEGEGSSVAPPPSDPRRPRIWATTRDGDVAVEAARLLRIKPLFVPVDRRNPNWSPLWRILKQGTRAVALMEAMKPIMGDRRTDQIESALRAMRRAQAKHRLRTKAAA